MPKRTDVKERKLAYHTMLNNAICRMIESNIELMTGKSDHVVGKGKQTRHRGKITKKKSRRRSSGSKRKSSKAKGVRSRKKSKRMKGGVGRQRRSNPPPDDAGEQSSEDRDEYPDGRDRRSRSVDRRRRSRSQSPPRDTRDDDDDYRVPEMGVNVRTAWDIGVTIGIMSLIMGVGKNVLLKTLLPHIVRGLEYGYGIDPEDRDRSFAQAGFPTPCSGSGYLRNMLLTGIGFQEHTCEDIDRMYTAAFRDEIGRFVRTVSLITGSTDVDMSYIVQGINALVFALILESVRRVPVYARIASRAPLTMGRVVGRTITTGTRMTGNVLASIGRTGYNTTYQGACLATRMMLWLVDIPFLLDTNSELYELGSRRFIAQRGFLRFCCATTHFTVDQFKRLYKLIKRNSSSAPVVTNASEFGAAQEEMDALDALIQMHDGFDDFDELRQDDDLGLPPRLSQGVHPRLSQGVLARQIDVSDLPDQAWIDNVFENDPDGMFGFNELENDPVLAEDTRSPSKNSRPSHPSPRTSATKRPLKELAEQILEDPRLVKKFDLREFIMRKLLDSAQRFTIEEQEMLVDTIIRNLRIHTDPSEEVIIAEINDVVMKHNST
jgi:hypothetical protein